MFVTSQNVKQLICKLLGNNLSKHSSIAKFVLVFIFGT